MLLFIVNILFKKRKIITNETIFLYAVIEMMLFPFRKYYKMNRNVLLWCKWTAAACASEISGWTLSRSRCATTDKNMPCRFVTFILFHFLHLLFSFIYFPDKFRKFALIFRQSRETVAVWIESSTHSKWVCNVMEWKLFGLFLFFTSFCF